MFIRVLACSLAAAAADAANYVSGASARVAGREGVGWQGGRCRVAGGRCRVAGGEVQGSRGEGANPVIMFFPAAAPGPHLYA